ncbi:MAG TPA: hypothetical protein VJQ44_10555 [Gemmatimonadales bacterium]|nr:hypothetical protein [Gemmatimonadales bacterium]
MSPTYRPVSAFVLLSGIILLLGCDGDRATAPEPVDRPALASGLPANPSTKEYKFNLIGVPRDKTPPMTDDQGKRMFVKLWGKSTINLQEGPFDVLDANATDKDGGLFQLPDPDPDNTGTTTYGVWVRTVGTPNRSATFQSCVNGDPDGADGAAPAGEYCSLETVTVERNAGKPKVYNVSQELLTICADTDGDKVCDKRIFLFDDDALDYLWYYDNSGLKNAQVWFFSLPQTIGLNP